MIHNMYSVVLYLYPSTNILLQSFLEGHTDGKPAGFRAEELLRGLFILQ